MNFLQTLSIAALIDQPLCGTVSGSMQLGLLVGLTTLLGVCFSLIGLKVNQTVVGAAPTGLTFRHLEAESSYATPNPSCLIGAKPQSKVRIP